MSARVLIVDDIDVNLRLLEAKLAREYYTVLSARDGLAALAQARTDRPDVILLDAMMPGLDGFETCRRLKEDPGTRHIPVIMVTALNEREDRVRGLEVGADDFLSKPVDDHQLFTRLRSLTRHKLLIDELLKREAMGRELGVIEGVAARESGMGARILLVDDNERQIDRVARALGRDHRPFTLAEVEQFGPAGQTALEIVVLSLAMRRADPLKFIAALRGQESTRHLPILAIVDEGEPERGRKALDLGASDLIARPIDLEELSARVRTLVKGKRFLAALRARLDQSFELAVTDQLTGLYNRRYMLGRLKAHLQRAAFSGEALAVLIADLDHFKKINDSYGHDMGDQVLKECAAILKAGVRPSDFACRYGGEEFVVVMPATGVNEALEIAERLRLALAATPIALLRGGERISLSMSVGVAANLPGEDDEAPLLRRADQALYHAKAAGRNRVVGYSASGLPAGAESEADLARRAG